MTTGRAALTSVGGRADKEAKISLTKPWVPVDYPIAAEVMKTALEQGANLWNGANSLHLVKYYFKKHPEDACKVVFSIKGVFNVKMGPNGSLEGIHVSVKEAVMVLGGIKTINIFECARVDPNIPIKTLVKALAKLVKEGKIGGISLSKVGANTIRKAHAVHPISAVEIELSLFMPDPLNSGVADACFGIPIVAYSPIGRGWLTDEFRKLDNLPQNDFRRMLPRFKPDVFDQNFKCVEAVEQIVRRKGMTTAQVVIGWVCRQGAIPIPGFTRVERVIENCKAALLTDEDNRQ